MLNWGSGGVGDAGSAKTAAAARPADARGGSHKKNSILIEKGVVNAIR